MHTFQNLILTDLQLLQKIRRIAYQIYENNFDETSIVFALYLKSTFIIFGSILQNHVLA